MHQPSRTRKQSPTPADTPKLTYQSCLPENQEDCRQISSSLFPQIQPPSLIPSSAAEHPGNIPCRWYLLWIPHIFLFKPSPPHQLFFTAPKSSRLHLLTYRPYLPENQEGFLQIFSFLSVVTVSSPAPWQNTLGIPRPISHGSHRSSTPF